MAVAPAGLEILAMAKIDKLLSKMLEVHAESLILRDEDSAMLLIGGQAKPITKPLPTVQVADLVREIATPAAQQAIDARQPTKFRYASPERVFTVRAMLQGDVMVVDFTVDADAEFKRSTGTFRAIDPDAAAGGDVPDAQTAAGDPGSAKVAMEKLLRMLVDHGGSDLHMRVGEPPILRKSGEMERIAGQSKLDPTAMEALLRSILPERNTREFAETNDTDFAHEITGVARFRANVLRDRKGMAAVFRVIPSTIVTADALGVSPEVQNLCYLTKGLVLVTGPTGSGKSTTLCALIDLVNRSRSDHVITIEDPIEFVHENKNCVITQRQVGVHTGSFKSALRAALREDPDIILVGELRDLETVGIAIETAETGHLVFGTLHTTTAASTIDRLIDQFPADRQEQVRTMLSESLKGVVSQVLCKKIGGGRVAAREILLVTPAVANLIREGKTFQIPSIMQTSKKLGMITMNDTLLDLVERKLVEPKEAWMKSVEKGSFVAALKAKGFDTSFAEADKDAVPGGAPKPAAR